MNRIRSCFSALPSRSQLLGLPELCAPIWFSLCCVFCPLRGSIACTPLLTAWGRLSSQVYHRLTRRNVPRKWCRSCFTQSKSNLLFLERSLTDKCVLWYFIRWKVLTVLKNLVQRLMIIFFTLHTTFLVNTFNYMRLHSLPPCHWSALQLRSKYWARQILKCCKVSLHFFLPASVTLIYRVGVFLLLYWSLFLILMPIFRWLE